MPVVPLMCESPRVVCEGGYYGHQELWVLGQPRIVSESVGWSSNVEGQSMVILFTSKSISANIPIWIVNRDRNTHLVAHLTDSTHPSVALD